ncbi:hypothetical protein M8C21_031292 [Ambrosia artemisiifolia]|uniref:Uncharacterized protein n=1 Tax=Ambrosia artemisiifolia TaxID=4212 RepID=A0AAD5BUJ0_AMBAR|nr:hypothetical protein M8C21_031292 [Ambrosia artemisiifolia]
MPRDGMIVCGICSFMFMRYVVVAVTEPRLNRGKEGVFLVMKYLRFNVILSARIITKPLTSEEEGKKTERKGKSIEFISWTSNLNALGLREQKFVSEMLVDDEAMELNKELMSKSLDLDDVVYVTQR